MEGNEDGGNRESGRPLFFQDVCSQCRRVVGSVLASRDLTISFGEETIDREKRQRTETDVSVHIDVGICITRVFSESDGGTTDLKSPGEKRTETSGFEPDGRSLERVLVVEPKRDGVNVSFIRGALRKYSSKPRCEVSSKGEKD